MPLPLYSKTTGWFDFRTRAMSRVFSPILFPVWKSVVQQTLGVPHLRIILRILTDMTLSLGVILCSWSISPRMISIENRKRKKNILTIVKSAATLLWSVIDLQTYAIDTFAWLELKLLFCWRKKHVFLWIRLKCLASCCFWYRRLWPSLAGNFHVLTN